ncbi:hypothetical protein O3M35_008196 [Rhynocoris fuscipes]|uniref:Uncharacterized protein n=1 Tax=Rhynocoris fuscipes TaxID=488301 RepID=A0AAW1D6X0_9HEMI
MTKNVMQVVGAQDMDDIKEKYKDPVVVLYKVELANVKVETILEELPQLMDQLRKVNYYLLDLDITQDFARVFNKTEMCDFCISSKCTTCCLNKFATQKTIA